MLKLILAGTAAIAFGATVLLLPDSQAAGAPNAAPAEGPLVQACTARGWPYRCETAAQGPAKTVRLVTTDRLAVDQIKVAAAPAAPQTVATAPQAPFVAPAPAQAIPVMQRAPQPATEALFDPRPVFSPAQIAALADGRTRIPNG